MSQATRVIKALGCGESPPLVHPTPVSTAPSHLIRARVALVRLIKDKEDVGGKMQGEVETLRETRWERQREMGERERGETARETATWTGAGMVAAGTGRGETGTGSRGAGVRGRDWAGRGKGGRDGGESETGQKKGPRKRNREKKSKGMRQIRERDSQGELAGGKRADRQTDWTGGRRARETDAP